MFIVNLPPRKVWVRKEYLYDLRKGHGEYVLGYWVSLKSISGRALYFETYLPEYGAVYDKLPISAFLDWDPGSPEAPVMDSYGSDDLPLYDLQYWDAFDYDVEIVPKAFLNSMRVRVRTRSGKTIEKGKYLFTIDHCHRDQNQIDLGYSEYPQEHKSHNCIVLPNGQIGLYPNNRCQWFDESLTPDEVKSPDFLVSTRPFAVEYGGDGGRLGDSEEYFWDYKSPGQRYFPRDDDLWTGQEDDPMDEALKAIENQVYYPPFPKAGARKLKDVRVTKPAANNYKGPLYAPYKKMPPIQGLEDYKGETDK